LPDGRDLAVRPFSCLESDGRPLWACGRLLGWHLFGRRRRLSKPACVPPGLHEIFSRRPPRTEVLGYTPGPLTGLICSTRYLAPLLGTLFAPVRMGTCSGRQLVAVPPEHLAVLPSLVHRKRKSTTPGSPLPPQRRGEPFHCPGKGNSSFLQLSKSAQSQTGPSLRLFGSGSASGLPGKTQLNPEESLFSREMIKSSATQFNVAGSEVISPPCLPRTGGYYPLPGSFKAFSREFSRNLEPIALWVEAKGLWFPLKTFWKDREVFWKIGSCGMTEQALYSARFQSFTSDSLGRDL
jgi:hypothetical protein